MSELKKEEIPQCVYLTKKQRKDLEKAYNKAYPNSVMAGRSLGKTKMIASNNGNNNSRGERIHIEGFTDKQIIMKAEEARKLTIENSNTFEDILKAIGSSAYQGLSSTDFDFLTKESIKKLREIGYTVYKYPDSVSGHARYCVKWM